MAKTHKVEGGIDQSRGFAVSDEELEKGYRLIRISSPPSDMMLDV